MRPIVFIFACLVATHARAVCGCIGVVTSGDSRTANRGDGQTPWPEQVTVTTAINVAVSGAAWTDCAAQVPTNTFRVAMQCGVNDILGGANGTTLWDTEKTWAEGRAANGWTTYVMSMPGFKAYDSTASKLTQRNNFNTAFASYCASPMSGVKCVDVAAALDDPMDHDSLLGAYSLDGLHFTTAGHAAVKSTFQGLYP